MVTITSTHQSRPTVSPAVVRAELPTVSTAPASQAPAATFERAAGGRAFTGFERALPSAEKAAPAGTRSLAELASEAVWKATQKVTTKVADVADKAATGTPIPEKGVGHDKYPGVPLEAPRNNAEGNRSPSRYDRVLDQFKVGSNPRYTPRDGKTFCNIFVGDATKAMGAPIPTAYDPKTGEPAKFNAKTGKWEGGHEHNANGMVDWLNNHGAKKGWKKVSAEEAQKHANEGKPAVAAWKNPTGGSGHVAMVRPGTVDPEKGPTIAQAGANNFDKKHVTDGFGKGKDVEYWVHE
ncbi:MAG: hypothetical protein AB2A00_41125 [Myxococcota bacterium]